MSALALRLLFLAAAAGLLALAFGQHLAAELYARPTGMRAVDTRSPAGRRPDPSPWVSAIVRRDLFDSDPPPYTAEARPEACGHDPQLVRPTTATAHTFEVDAIALAARLHALSRLCRVVRIRPYHAQGLQVGFELFDLPPGGIYRALGLCSGDVLVAVNGQRLSSPTKALEFYEALRALAPTDALTLTVLRGPDVVTLNWRVP